MVGKLAVEVKSERLIINTDEMEIDKRYTVKYKGEIYVVVKGKSGKIYIYEALQES